MSGTINFISMLKLETEKTISPNRLLEALRSGSINSIEDLFRDLSSYPIIKCLEVRVGDSHLNMTYSEIHRESFKCWLSNLKRIMELTSPEESYISLTELYVGRYEIREIMNLLRMIKNGVRPEGFEILSNDILSKATTNISQLALTLRELRSRTSKIIADSLILQSESDIRNVDFTKLTNKILEEYWRKLNKVVDSLHPKSKLKECTRILKSLDLIEEVVRDALLKGGGLPQLKLDPAVTSIIERYGNKEDIDLAFKIIKYVSCYDELRYSPLSADTIMPYLVGKEIELDLVSLTVYTLSRGLTNELIEILDRWVKIYEEITGA